MPCDMKANWVVIMMQQSIPKHTSVEGGGDFSVFTSLSAQRPHHKMLLWPSGLQFPIQIELNSSSYTLGTCATP
eukprot:2815782-Rhodomonas_salina.2